MTCRRLFWSHEISSVHTTAVLQGEQNTFIKVLLENQMKKDANSQSFTLTCTKSGKYTMFKITQLLHWNQNTSFLSFFFLMVLSEFYCKIEHLE